VPSVAAARVDGEHDALAAELHGGLGDEVGSRIAAVLSETLSAPACKHAADVGEGADAPAHGQRHEDLFAPPADDVHHRIALLVRGGDVEEGQLVGALFLVGAGGFDGIARVAQFRRTSRL
jgi:hypothetical protein